MKIAYILRGMLSLALLFAITAVGCNTGGPETSAKTYTVTFDGGDGSGTPPASQSAEENGSITLPGKGSLTAPAGKEFNGWKAGGTVYTAGDSYTVTADTLFVAQWKGVERTVTFDADGGTPVTTSQKVNSGEAVGTLPANPAKTNFNFDGWYTEKNGGGTQFTAVTIVDADITVYAKWAAGTPQLKVTFDADGGTPATTEKEVSDGKVEALPTNPTRTGYTFDGWYTEKKGGGTQFTATITVTANITVYAKWKSDNPLLGAWTDDVNDPYELEIFNAEYHFSVTGTLNQEANYDPVNNETELKLSVSGASRAYAFELSNSDNTLTVKGYKAGTGTNPATDITFTRILDSSKTDAKIGVYGAWYTASGVSSEDKENTLLVILANNKVFTSFDRDTTTYDAQGEPDELNTDEGNWVRWRYEIIADMIRWPDTPNINNRFTIDKDGNLNVSWGGDPEDTYIKLEL